jgi:ligand-binding sensor domain-containing protein
VKNSNSLAAIIAIAMLGILVIMVGSIKKRPVITETEATANETALPETAAFNDQNEFGPEVTTIFVDGDKLVIGTDNGLYLMPLNHPKRIPPEPISPEKRELGSAMIDLNVILPIGNDRYAGGNGLYKLDSDYTATFAGYYPGETVNAVMEYGDGILVGTDKGLWFHCTDPTNETGCVDAFIKPGIIVTALAKDHDGLWVGTYGDGLLFFDGRNWQERYLRRDTFALAFVNALDYSYPNLWVGTDEGIFRYDGGKWSQLFVNDSSEVYAVTSIMTARAATYIGTEGGLLRYSDGCLETADDFMGMAITKLCATKKDLIVATRTNGIYTYNGKEEIVSPEQLTFQAMPDSTNKEVLAGTEEYYR